jgi:hypothetical protein
MNTKILMTVSALIMGVTGCLLLFFPQEISNYLLLNEANSIFFQVFGSLYVGFAMLNWTAKGSLLGGIYGRPVVIANISHFAIGTLALIKWLVFYNYYPYVWVITILYFIFAVLFGITLFTHPLPKR